MLNIIKHIYLKEYIWKFYTYLLTQLFYYFLVFKYILLPKFNIWNQLVRIVSIINKKQILLKKAKLVK